MTAALIPDEPEEDSMRSPIIWFGGKSRLAPAIIRHMPAHKCYVEPFGGGAHVITQKPPVGIEVYNDIDEDLVNFLLVNREDTERLAKALSNLPYSRSLYEEWKWAERPQDRFERAVRWFYNNRSAVAAGNNHRSGWRHGKEVNPAKDYHTAITLLADFAERFKYVMIECRDFREVIKTYDGPETLFYLDPPYRGNENRYKGGFTEQDHIEMADLLETIQGRAIVSYYSDDLIDDLYQGWRKVEIKSHAFAQVQKDCERSERTELLLMNWHDPQINIFEAMEAERGVTA